jgi:thioredoxin-related protein
MGRLILAVAGLLLAAGARAEAPGERAIEVPKWFAESFLDLRDEVRDAARDGKRVMLYFGQEGCPYCKALMKADFGEPDIAGKVRRHFVAIALDLWGDREATWVDGRTMPEKELARRLAVQFTPTLLFLDDKGGVDFRLNGYLPPESFRIALDYATLRDAKREPFTDYLARRKAAKPAAPDVSEPFFERGAPDFPRILREGKPVLVLYEYDGCRDCRELRREGFARPEVRALLARYTVVALDLAGERRVVTPEGRATDERAWARSLAVAYAPTLVFLDGAGHEAFRSEGYLRPFHLAGALAYVADGAYRREPSFQRYLRERSDAVRASGKPVDLWE